MNSRSRLHMQGFTLVELLIAMVIATIVLAAIYGAYIVQQNHYLAQSQVTDMQQNVRAAMDLITRDIRMAGYDPSEDADAKLLKMENDLIYFTADLDGNGKVDEEGEHIAYDLYTESGVSTLGRATNTGSGSGDPDETSVTVTDKGGGHFEADAAAPAGHHPVAQVIEALRFTYLDEDGAVTADPVKVRTIVVSILARAGQPDPKFTNSASYTTVIDGVTYTIGGPWPRNDNFRRRFYQMTVQCRNLGL